MNKLEAQNQHRDTSFHYKSTDVHCCLGREKLDIATSQQLVAIFTCKHMFYPMQYPHPTPSFNNVLFLPNCHAHFPLTNKVKTMHDTCKRTILTPNSNQAYILTLYMYINLYDSIYTLIRCCIQFYMFLSLENDTYIPPIDWHPNYYIVTLSTIDTGT